MSARAKLGVRLPMLRVARPFHQDLLLIFEIVKLEHTITKTQPSRNKFAHHTRLLRPVGNQPRPRMLATARETRSKRHVVAEQRCVPVNTGLSMSVVFGDYLAGGE